MFNSQNLKAFQNEPVFIKTTDKNYSPEGIVYLSLQADSALYDFIN